jgi:MFS family permease
MVMLGAIFGIPGFVILPYSVSYLVKLGVDESFASLSVTGGSAVGLFAVLGGGYLSDYVGRLKVIRVFVVLTIAMIFPYFFLLSTRDPLSIMFAQMLFDVLLMVGYGCIILIMGEGFATKFRYSGSGIAYQVGQLFWNGLITTILVPMYIMTYGIIGASQPVAWTTIAVCIVAVVATFFVKETRGTTLDLE